MGTDRRQSRDCREHCIFLWSLQKRDRSFETHEPDHYSNMFHNSHEFRVGLPFVAWWIIMMENLIIIFLSYLHRRRLKLEPLRQFGLMMDGPSMGIAFENFPELLRIVATNCEALVCCRMSPLQKCEVNRFVTCISRDFWLDFIEWEISKKVDEKCNDCIEFWKFQESTIKGWFFFLTDRSIDKEFKKSSFDSSNRWRRQRRVYDSRGSRWSRNHRQRRTSSDDECRLCILQIHVPEESSTGSWSLVLRTDQYFDAIFFLQKHCFHNPAIAFWFAQWIFIAGKNISSSFLRTSSNCHVAFFCYMKILQAVYDSIFFMCFNLFFTSVPILCFGLLEQDYSANKLLRFPQNYKLNRRNRLFSRLQSAIWVLIGNFWRYLHKIEFGTFIDTLGQIDPVVIFWYSSVETSLKSSLDIF